MVLAFAAFSFVGFGSDIISCYRGSPSVRNLAIGSVMQCLHPVPMYVRFVDKSGKMHLSSKVPAFRKDGDPDFFVPCGKCEFCVDERRKVWSRRLEMATWCSTKCTFITLTYNDERLPANGCAVKSDVQNFIKRFRHLERDFGIELSDDFKYFIVSEYGDKLGRPHYHGVLFGVDCFDVAWQPRVALIKDGHPVYTSPVLEKIWRNGFVSFDAVNPRSIGYVSMYMFKQVPDKVNFHLYSRCLGLDYLVDGDNFTPAGLQAVRNGFICYKCSKGHYKAALPPWFNRYVERIDPFLFDCLKESRRQFALCAVPDLRLPSERVVALRQKLDKSLKERKLDNES